MINRETAIKTNFRVLKKLLRGITLAVTTLALASCFATSPPDVESPRITIVGAGAAGLASAKTLQEQGFEVKILEARDRIGGRTWSQQLPSGATIDLGASWIHGSNPEFEALVASLNIATINTEFSNLRVYDTQGNETQLNSEVADDLISIFTLGIIKANIVDGAVSIASVIEELWENNSLADYSLEFINFMSTAFFETEYAASVEDLSVRSFLIGLGGEGEGDYIDQNLAFPGGYNQVTDYLSANLDIELNTLVEHIDYSQDPLVITTNRGTYETDLILVTVPIGVLKSGNIGFSPALPSWKQKSIDRLQSGLLNKLYLEFPVSFWDENSDMLGISQAEKGGLALWVNMEKVTGKPILMAFSSGRSAAEIEQLGDAEIIELGMARLRQAYGDDIPEPVNYKISRWLSDPFAQGSYSYIGLETGLGDRRRLSLPVEARVLFAGEATLDSPSGTVPGAYLSGIREADRIVEWYGE